MLQLYFLPEPQHQFMECVIWHEIGYKLAGIHGLGSCPRAQVHFPVHLHAFQCQVFSLFFFFFIFSFGICLDGASSLGNTNVLKTALLPAQIHLAGQALLLYSGSVALGGFAGDQSVAACAWPALGSCCGRSPWGIQYPGLHSTFLCHGSAAKDHALFPASLLSLCWPQTRPLLAARSPLSSPGPSHSSGTKHPD